MDKVQQIRAEVERQKREHAGSPECVCDDILSFIDSLTEQTEEIPPKFPLISPKDSNIGENGKNLQEFTSEELDEEIKNYLEGEYAQYAAEVTRAFNESGSNSFEVTYDLSRIARHFANWQREQMMKDAIEADVTFDYIDDQDRLFVSILATDVPADQHSLKENSKVKLIIIKENKQ